MELRGLLVRTLMAALLAVAAPATAHADFLDWWLTPDQQGRLHYERGEYAEAAQRFADPVWKGLAYYAAEDFGSAAAVFETLDTPESWLYLGNSRANQERLEEAVVACQRALALQPEFPEASFNLDWVTGMLERQQKQYEDAGGTGGKLAADEIVYDDRAKQAKAEMTAEQARAQGVSDEQLEELWMRRVQTRPADFLREKFSIQLVERAAGGTP